MYFCYAGLMMVAVIFLLCLWHAIQQWSKANRLQKQAQDSETRLPYLEDAEQNCRGYAALCLLAASAAAVFDIIAGGIIGACGG